MIKLPGWHLPSAPYDLGAWSCLAGDFLRSCDWSNSGLIPAGGLKNVPGAQGVDLKGLVGIGLSFGRQGLGHMNNPFNSRFPDRSQDIGKNPYVPFR